MDNDQSTDPVYRHVGQRIKERRKALNISQSRLGELMDVSYQLIQKYESGMTQISVSRLLQFATILNVAPEYFYEGVPINTTIGKRIESDIIQARSRPLYILLVDDKAADALLLSRALASHAETVRLHALNDPEKVADFLNHHSEKYDFAHVDLILLDLNMPKISGLQLLKELKASRHTAAKPIVMLTNSVSKREMNDAYAHGCAGLYSEIDQL